MSSRWRPGPASASAPPECPSTAPEIGPPRRRRGPHQAHDSAPEPQPVTGRPPAMSVARGGGRGRGHDPPARAWMVISATCSLRQRRSIVSRRSPSSRSRPVSWTRSRTDQRPRRTRTVYGAQSNPPARRVTVVLRSRSGAVMRRRLVEISSAWSRCSTSSPDVKNRNRSTRSHRWASICRGCLSNSKASTSPRSPTRSRGRSSPVPAQLRMKTSKGSGTHGTDPTTQKTRQQQYQYGNRVGHLP